MTTRTFNIRSALGVRPVTVEVDNETRIVTAWMVTFLREKKTHRFSLPENVTTHSFLSACSAWENGAYVAQAFPWMSAEDREFLISGTTPEEWKAMYGSDDDES